MQETLAIPLSWTAPFWASFVVFLRIGTVVALMPAFGETSVPMRVKLGLSVAFTLVVAPAVALESPALSWASFVRFAGSEVLVGAILGAGLRLFVVALQTAGSIAAQSTSLAQMIGGSVEPVPAMGYVLMVTGLAIAVTFGLHVKAAALMINSYIVFPIGTLPQGGALAEWGSGQVARSFRLAFSLAAPFVIASFLYNVTLGVINRAMPQLMVAFVGAPFTTFTGLALLLLSANGIILHWWQILDLFLGNPFGSLP